MQARTYFSFKIKFANSSYKFKTKFQDRDARLLNFVSVILHCTCCYRTLFYAYIVPAVTSHYFTLYPQLLCTTLYFILYLQLLYTLLYKRHVFLPFATQPNFSDICMNIDIVLNYLMNKLEKTTTDPSVADVQVLIRRRPGTDMKTTTDPSVADVQVLI